MIRISRLKGRDCVGGASCSAGATCTGQAAAILTAGFQGPELKMISQ
jgi:hypothetical protein